MAHTVANLAMRIVAGRLSARRATEGDDLMRRDIPVAIKAGSTARGFSFTIYALRSLDIFRMTMSCTIQMSAYRDAPRHYERR